MASDRAAPDEVKLYFDYKSPYAFLAADPAFALEERFRLRLRWMPCQLRIKGRGERSVRSEWKVKYSYLDARRWAAPRGIIIKGPRKIYDTRPALIGALYAMRADCFRVYTQEAFRRFFLRELELDESEAIAVLLGECGASADGYREYLAGEGPAEQDQCEAQAEADHAFGVPLFFFRDQPFWGYDRLPVLEECLSAAGLRR